MITVHVTDAQGFYLRTEEIDEFGPQPPCAVYGAAPPELTGSQVAKWDGAQWAVLTERPPAPAISQFELDRLRYTKRAAAKDGLLAYMAADNMSRVRTGVWSVADLMTLLEDPAVAAANAYMSTLSYELAVQSIAAASTPLLTPEIRADWTARLAEHFYLES